LWQAPFIAKRHNKLVVNGYGRIAGSNMLALYKQWGEIGWLSKDVGPYFTTIAELQAGA
jgi:hypothetical protein